MVKEFIRGVGGKYTTYAITNKGWCREGLFFGCVVITLVPPVAVLMRIVVVEVVYGVAGIGVAG